MIDKRQREQAAQPVEKIVVMGGSFNPPTLAHQKILLAAMEALGADRGLFVPSSRGYVQNKMEKLGQPQDVFSEQLRLEMLRAMAAEDSRLAVEDMEFHRTGKAYTYETMEAVQARYPAAKLYFLAGGDKVEVIARWHRIQEFLERFSIVVIRRDGEDPRTAIQAHPFLRRYQERFQVIEAPVGIEGMSSSALRDKLRRSDPGAKALCHPGVWELLQKSGALEQSVISAFQGEYRFLSNFWDSPVTYQGLTYKNNEAAFQAQKSLRQEEKLPFTAMDPAEAKSRGRQIGLRPDWEEVKLGIMEEIVRAKFTQNHALRQQLLDTGDRELREGNSWHDTFWGVDLRTGKGENHLGKILMKVRSELARDAAQGESTGTLPQETILRDTQQLLKEFAEDYRRMAE